MKDTATYRTYHDWATGAGIRQPVDIDDRFTLCSGNEQVTFTVVSAGTDGTAAGSATAPYIWKSEPGDGLDPVQLNEPAGLAFARVGARLLPPLAWAAPLALVQVAYDARNRSRGLLPELCGAAALAASAAAIAVAEGFHVRFAMALWAVAAGRTLPAMVTVRTRVLRLHGEAASATPPLLAHVSAMAAIFWLQTQALVPRGVLTLLSILAARAGFSLRASAPRVRAQRIGIEELTVGLAAAVLLGVLTRR